ncbi:hypothetical protein STRDD11_00543 [Streptococcus sp. DD11]|nr:hypothetical protein STRDD11_00543 [Streptococcus sp. DD11]
MTTTTFSFSVFILANLFAFENTACFPFCQPEVAVVLAVSKEKI